jgi:hypothetical protein
MPFGSFDTNQFAPCDVVPFMITGTISTLTLGAGADVVDESVVADFGDCTSVSGP